MSLAAECAFTGPGSFEPFPSFLLIKEELRKKRGYLDNVQEAKQKGSTKVEQTNDKNKDIKTICALYKHLESIPKLV